MRASFISSEVLTGLRRNITMTIAMILTTAISLGLFGGGLLVVQMAGKTQQIFLDRVEVQIFLTDDISANRPAVRRGHLPDAAYRPRTDPRGRIGAVSQSR
jgi:cell division transport system permease protein